MGGCAQLPNYLNPSERLRYSILTYSFVGLMPHFLHGFNRPLFTIQAGHKGFLEVSDFTWILMNSLVYGANMFRGLLKSYFDS